MKAEENCLCRTECDAECTIITAGSAYLDIDAYACCVAMKELLELKGKRAYAYSAAAYNYSVCKSLVEKEQIINTLPSDDGDKFSYIIVDVSDPEYIKKYVPLNRVEAVYDHHSGFEDFWEKRLGKNSHIEFIGAAATLVYCEWKKANLQEKMKNSTALLLIAAILDNTLNLTSSNTTDADREAFNELCRMAGVGEQWCAAYFAEVQASVEADLRNALFHDIKQIRDTDILPPRVAQLCVWDAESILENLDKIREWFETSSDSWMINIVDIQHRRSYFVCDDEHHQRALERIFGVPFDSGVAKSDTPYLRKEIIKKINLSESLKK